MAGAWRTKPLPRGRPVQLIAAAAAVAAFTGAGLVDGEGAALNRLAVVGGDGRLGLGLESKSVSNVTTEKTRSPDVGLAIRGVW